MPNGLGCEERIYPGSLGNTAYDELLALSSDVVKRVCPYVMSACEKTISSLKALVR